MIKNFLIAAALLIASPALVFSQDFFWSFDSTSFNNSAAATVGDTGTAYIFSDGLLDYDAVDLSFTSSSSSVLLFTGGAATNPTFNSVGGTRFDSTALTIDPDFDSGNLFAVNISQNGVDPASGPMLDPDFDANVGPNGAVLLASVDYDIVGVGTTEILFSINSGDTLPGQVFIPPTLGSATLTAVNVPEPSSAVLLALSAAGMIAHRRRFSA